jgi:hypothetical protein
VPVDGRPVDITIVEANDKRLADFVAERFAKCIYRPARLDGTLVRSLARAYLEFGSRGANSGDNGLGLGSGDR